VNRRDRDTGQAFYAWLKRERELEHDAQIYRAYEREAARLEARGLEIERVRLDYELKREYQHSLHERDRDRRDADGRPDRDGREIEQWAHDRDLPYFDGRCIFPTAASSIVTSTAARITSMSRLLEGVTHHVLRHTGASAMVAAGISLRVVQDIGGWSTLRMLERYAHPSGAEMSRAVRVLTVYTTGTKTGTATKNGNGDPKNTDAASVVKSEVTKWRPQRDSNPRFGLERATSWASGRWGRVGWNFE
jgi:hypothetical protein